MLKCGALGVTPDDNDASRRPVQDPMQYNLKMLKNMVSFHRRPLLSQDAILIFSLCYQHLFG